MVIVADAKAGLTVLQSPETHTNILRVASQYAATQRPLAEASRTMTPLSATLRSARVALLLATLLLALGWDQ
jgi:hypothetical protein